VNWEARPNRGLVADDALLFALTRIPPPATETTSVPRSESAAAAPGEPYPTSVREARRDVAPA